MTPVAFAFQAPRTVENALALLSAASVPLAGGQSLVPLLSSRSTRPATVVDLNSLPELAGIRLAADTVEIGAMTRLRDVEHSAVLRDVLPVLPHAAADVANRQIRHRGTVGGSLCHADPSAQLPAVVVALGGRLHLRSAGGERVVPADAFFLAPHVTVRRPDELLTAVTIPLVPAMRFRFAAVSRRGEAGFPLISVCVGVSRDDPDAGHSAVVTAARLGASGVAGRPLRLATAEAALTGSRLTDTPDASLGAVLDGVAVDCEPPSDHRGGSTFRLDVLRTVIRREVIRLISRRDEP